MSFPRLILFLTIALVLHLLLVGGLAWWNSSGVTTEVGGMRQKIASILKSHPAAPLPDILGTQDFYLGVKEDELGAYQAGLYCAVASRWYEAVRQEPLQSARGRVRVKFHVDPSGNLSEVTILDGGQNGELAALAEKAVIDASGQFGPLPEGLKATYIQGFNDAITFSLYKKVDLKLLKPQAPQPAAPL